MPRASKRSPRREKAEDAPRESAGPRPTWSGSLSFGLVSIPVMLFPATHAAGPRAHLFAEDGSPLTRHYYCPAEDRDLEDDDLVRGFELPDQPGKYVEVDDDELRALAPKKSREIALHAFTDRSALHESFFERGYVLSPAETGVKAYHLLAQAMQRGKRAGIASFVLREREYLVAIVAQDGLLLAETLRFADELRTPKDVGLPARKKPGKAGERVARALIKLQRGRFSENSLVDPAHAKLEALLAQKKKRGEVVQPPEQAPAPAAESGGEVVDLMALLRQSLQGSSGGSSRSRKRARAS